MSNRDRYFMWDYFVDACAEAGLDPAVEDFDEWCDRAIDAALDASIEF